MRAMKYTNFKNYVHYRLGCTIGRNYDNYEELISHLESGNVTLPVTLAIQLQEEFEAQKLASHEYFTPEEKEEIAKEAEAERIEQAQLQEISEINSFINSILTGEITGSCTLDRLFR